MHVVSIVVFFLWVLALVRTILNLLLVRRLSTDAQPPSEALVSIVIPARNESHIIEDTVRAFLAQDYPHFELIVVNDRSTDDTAEILSRIADRRFTVIDGEEPPPGWLGKPWALDQGSRRARGELILFVDADIIYAPSALRAAVADLLASDAALIAVFPRYEAHGFGEQTAMGMMAITLSLFPVWLFDRWQHPRLGIGGGSGNLVRREAIERMDHFTALRDAVVDDIALAQQVRRSGGTTHVVRAEHLVRVRMYHGVRAVIEGFTKNIFAGLGRSYAIATSLWILMIVCHLFPYAYALTGDWAAIATVVMISLTRVVAFRAGRYSMLNAIFLHPLMIALWAYIFLRSVWITGIRNQVRWRGRVYDAAQTR